MTTIGEDTVAYFLEAAKAHREYAEKNSWGTASRAFHLREAAWCDKRAEEEGTKLAGQVGARPAVLSRLDPGPRGHRGSR